MRDKVDNDTRDFVIKNELLKLSDNLGEASDLTKTQMEFKLLITKNRVDKMLLHYGVDKFDNPTKKDYEDEPS